MSHCDGAHHLHVEAASIEIAAAVDRRAPFALYKPRLFPDGDHWCALLGENLQEGVSGFGKSPYEAAEEFNKAWFKKL